MWSVFQVRPGVLGDDRSEALEDLQKFLAAYENTDVVVRGIYDIAGMRADADFMIWTHAERIEDLQKFYAEFRRSTIVGRASNPVWSNVALHRPPAEFNKSHVPAFIAGEDPGNYICVYPFVRSYEWYLLPDETGAGSSPSTARPAAATRTCGRTRCRRSRSATTSGSSPSRPPELDRIVDLMRDLRATEARYHVRLEIPFFTGPRIDADRLINALP